MPHVSSKKLDPKLLEKLFRKLIAIFERAYNKTYLNEVIKELFTATEKTMLAKRLAIILLLSSHTPQEKIVNILKVSPTTVSKASIGIEIGKYNAILKISQKEKVDLEKIVWQILTVGGIMPPKVGRKYWRKYSKK